MQNHTSPEAQADAVRFALAIGCPKHGNAAMDVDLDNGQPYCEICDYDNGCSSAGYVNAETLAVPAETIPFTDGTPRCTTCHRAAHKPGTYDGHWFTTSQTVTVNDTGKRGVIVSVGQRGYLVVLVDGKRLVFHNTEVTEGR